MSISLSSQLSKLVYVYSQHAGDFFQHSLVRPLGESIDSKAYISLLSNIATLRYTLEYHCQTELCELSADHVQTLFSMLDIAKSSLERIK